MKRFLRFLFLFAFLLPSLALASPSQVDFLMSGMTNTNGQALSGGKIYTYIAGTTTNKTTWSDFAETTPHANPIILDAYGRKQVFADGLYKFVVKDANDVTLYTFDNIYFANYNGVLTYAGATTGSPNAYVATLSPALLSLTDGAEITFVPNFTNTAAATLNVNSLGAKNILRHDLTSTVARDLVSGAYYTARYSTTNTAWVLMAPALGYTTWTPGLSPQNGTATAITYTVQNYIVLGKFVCIQNYTTWTQNTATALYVEFTLPVTPSVAAQNLSAFTTYDGATNRGGYAFVQSIVGNGTVRVYDTANNSFTVGAARNISVSGCYFTS